MGKIQFLMNTNGHCFLCLKLATSTTITTTRANVSSYEENLENISPVVKQMDPKIYSFRNICQYLKIDIKEVSNEAMPISSKNPTPVLDNSELKGVLCNGCASTFQRFSRNLLELEEMKMKLRFSLESIYDIIVAADRSDGMDPDEFEREMLIRQQTSLKSEFVEQLRRKTLQRCSTMIGKGGPFVNLKKIKTFEEEPETIMPPPEAVHKQITVTEKQNQLSKDVPPGPEGENDNFSNLVDLGTTSSIQEIFLAANSTRNKPVKAIIAVHSSSSSSVLSTQPGKDNLPQPQAKRKISSRAQLKISDNEELKFKCHICDKRFKRLLGLKRHRESAHVGHSHRVKCRFCSRTFKSTFVRNHHILTRCPAKFPPKRDGHLNNSTLPNCLSSSPDKSNKSTHYDCYICRKSYPRQSKLDNERLHFHGSMTVCQKCHGQFELRPVKGRRNKNKTGEGPSVDQPIYVVQRRKGVAVAASIEEADGGHATSSQNFVHEEAENVQQAKPKSKRGRKPKRLDNVPKRPKAISDSVLVTPMDVSSLRTLKREAMEEMDVEEVETKDGDNAQIEITAVNKFKLRCKFCSKRFASKITMRQHLIHFHRAKYACEFCEKVFKHDLSLYIHQRAVHFRRNLELPIEDDGGEMNESDQAEEEDEPEATPSEASNDDGMPHLEIEVEDTTSSWEQLCNNDISDRSQMSPFLESLGLHRRNHFEAVSNEPVKLEDEGAGNDETANECDVCQETVADLETHKCTYVETTLKWNENGEVEGEDVELKLPRLTIINPKTPSRRVESILNRKSGRHKCRTCSKEFPRESAFQNHYKSVHLQVRYKCDLCGKDYPYRSEYTRHHRDAHVGIRFKCDLCSRAFTTQTILWEHRQNVHLQDGSESEEDDEPTPRPSSSKSVRGQGQNKKQIGTPSKMDSRLKCDICHKFCTTMSNLHKHKRRVHVGQILKCQNCLRTFSSVSNRNQHVRFKRCIKGKSGRSRANI